MKNKRREVEGISLSFLDVVSCGFGAIILLLVLTKVFDPIVLEETIEDITAYLEQLEAQLFDIRGETRELNREMIRKEEEKSDEHERLAQLEAKLEALKGQYEATVDKSKIDNTIQGQLAEAKQKMTLELQKLLVEYQKQQEANMIGGIPVDSEYVIFLIDTSGSMRSVAWPLVIRKVSETLAVYPQLKGIQVMNDQGHYMFPRFAGEWIVDTQQRRREIIERLSFWQAQSRSNPTNGIADAVGTFYRPGRKISIYVFGDD
ncbi:MAG: VWA domain-containing protein, partial [Gammaproteobacteria bacterium]|nr:VWA domain-containing protein [Gammaproteobacteria bacterium]